MLMVSPALDTQNLMLWVASEIEILKLQETIKQYTGKYDEILLSTKTSGWSKCKEYANSFWIKKMNWIEIPESYFRLTNDPQ